MISPTPSTASFRAIARLRAAGVVPDPLAVRAELCACGALKEAGGAEYLARVVEIVPTTANLGHHAKMVVEAAAARKLRAALDRGDDLGAVLEATRGRLDRAARRRLARLCTVRAADVEPEAVDWVWGGRIPRGKPALLVGDTGEGKSTLVLTIAADVTRGRPLPGDTATVGPADVLVISAEDGIADTIRPRLDAAGPTFRGSTSSSMW